MFSLGEFETLVFRFKLVGLLSFKTDSKRVFFVFREVGNIAKELQAANKNLNQLEASVEAEKANRHSLLKQCKM
jgi:hypothetical protein